ncbi:RNA 2'-phosphotransferase [Nocardia sp. 2]|uniref:Probable RNA 2'-phosphotransferase n=1 Tax=Nocardia acididurans TaxID=2802282 RepID=A0ABS1MA49_9NOCA|nr:RNA 2'-phosphotransferase [Nocardia acididurans]MBL1077429.1 RNA 2'-phosphotransferase [Nocardia acididurans]
MDDARLIKTSKRLSYHLRHAPGEIGLEPDAAGWVGVSELLAGLAGAGRNLSRADLDEVVARNDKRRFEFDVSGTRIRASQGHSIDVELDYQVSVAPDLLYHGTVASVLGLIHAEGLKPMRRHAVHLSASYETAVRVGARRGKPVVLTVDAAAMQRDGYEFHVSTNGVWLVAAVPPAYLAPFTAGQEASGTV